MLWACILLPQLAMDSALRQRSNPDAPLALLGRPQGVASAGLQQDQVAQVDRGGQPGLRIRYIGGADQDDTTLRLGQASEGRHQ